MTDDLRWKAIPESFGFEGIGLAPLPPGRVIYVAAVDVLAVLATDPDFGTRRLTEGLELLLARETEHYR